MALGVPTSNNRHILTHKNSPLRNSLFPKKKPQQPHYTSVKKGASTSDRVATAPTHLLSPGRVEGLQPRGGVSQHVEVGGGGGPHRSRSAVRIHLVVHQPPLLQERMYPAQDPPHHRPPSGQPRRRKWATQPQSLAPLQHCSLKLEHTHLIMAHTSPAKFLRQAVTVRYSVGFNRYVSIIKLRYAMYLKWRMTFSDQGRECKETTTG